LKLFTRYSRISVIPMIIIFIVASSAFYFTLQLLLIRQIDHDLEIEEGEINIYVSRYNKLPEIIPVKDQYIEFVDAKDVVQRQFDVGRREVNGHLEKQRQLQFPLHAAGKNYLARVSKSLSATDRLLNSIFIILLITILAMLLATYLLNRFILKRIWRPFYHSLDAVKKFKLGSNYSIQLAGSSIDEFTLMNDIIEKMTTQARNDYVTLKSFSEDASHEIQTPVAIIRSKLDLMIQDENLTEKQTQAINALFQAVDKLSSLNRALLLLVKIENNQFSETQTVDLTQCVELKIEEFRELWQMQEIRIDANLKPRIVQMNVHLADVLLNNLLSNATQHNYPGGFIEVALNEHFLKVSNTSRHEQIDSQVLFKRFFTSGSNSSGNGLGLSIIKRIADSSSFGIEYACSSNIHSFTILF
jgi:signal transduction histidine kinase